MPVELGRRILSAGDCGGEKPPRAPGKHKESTMFSLFFADSDGESGGGRENFGRIGFFAGTRTGAAAPKRLVLSGRQVSSVGAPGWKATRLHRTPLLLLAMLMLGSLVAGALCGPPTHSLCYFYLHLPEPSPGLPQSFVRGYLDEQPITQYDSISRKVEPLVPWMEEVEKETFLAPEWVFRTDLEKLSKLDHQTGGLHTWQLVVGCELREDGSKGGFLHYGYNGRDFISFDKETLRWVTAQPQAQKVKEMWEDHPRWSQENKVFLEETCIVWLQRYLSCQKEAPQRIANPSSAEKGQEVSHITLQKDNKKKDFKDEETEQENKS